VTSTGPIDRLRRLALALPETTEKPAWGEATFRVGGKMFAMTDDHHHGAGHVAVWCKATILDQSLLVAGQPRQCFVPPYVGVKGWVGVRLDGRANWKLVESVVQAAWRLAAPPAVLRRAAAKRPAPSAAGRASRPSRRRPARTRGA
jgi:hypothetical protein